MASGGMPYNKLTATLAFKDGVITSDNMFIDSNAMNVSAIGYVNLVKDDMNVTIGVQPLQTMDKVAQYSTLSMGFCVNCHRDVTERGVDGMDGKHHKVAPSIDCAACHY